MTAIIKENKSKIIKVLVLIGIVLSAFGLLTKVFEFTVYDYLKKESLQYTQSSYEESKKLFVTLSVLKGTMAVIEGSTLNANAVVGVDIELGDIVEPVYDMVNILWRTSLVSVVILKIETLYFEFFSTKLSSLLITISLIGLAPSLFFRNKVTMIIRKISKYIFFSFLFIYVLIPFVLFLTSMSVNKMEKEYRVPAIERINKNVTELSNSAESFFKLEENTSIFNFKSQIDSYSGKIDLFNKNANNVSSSISEDVPLILGVTIFGYIILPLMISFFLYKLVRALIISKINK